MDRNDLEITPPGIQVDEPEVEELLIVIDRMRQNSLRPEICIYKIPPRIREIKKVAFSPQVISIGPIHHDPCFLKMDEQKRIYFKEFCESITGRTKKEVVRDLLGIIREHKKHIERCYGDEIRFRGIERMILLDAMFIIEFVSRGLNQKYKNDFIIGQPTLREAVVMDLLLLENQLPYFVLNKLYEKLERKEKFFKLVCNCFPIYNQLDPVFESLKEDDILHFVDLMRYILCAASRAETNIMNRMDWDFGRVKLKYSASKLHQAGVVFKVAEGSKSLLAVDFDIKSGVLKMPILEVDENFETIYRNVMAFEQCHYQYESYICNYIFLMDHLINTAEDVDLFTEAGIIIHWLGSNKMMANLINSPCKGVDIYGSCYNNICGQLNEYYEDPQNRRKATLKLVYFSNLWRGTATVAATLLLIMTLIQTICSIKSLF